MRAPAAEQQTGVEPHHSRRSRDIKTRSRSRYRSSSEFHAERELHQFSAYQRVGE